MNLRFVPAITLLGLATGCSDPPGQYRLSTREVYQRLSKADFKDFMRNRLCGVLIHIKSDGGDGKSVNWRITSSGQDMLNFTARLTPVSANRTKVAIEVQKEINGREAYDGTQFYRRPAVMQPVRPAIQEQIAALLEDRPFNPAHLQELPSDTGTFGKISRDTVCNVQRGRLEEGEPFSVDDPIPEDRG